MRYALLVSCALGLTGVAQADELIIHTVSYHSDANRDKSEQWTTVNVHGQTVTHTRNTKAYNNFNYGLGYRTDSGWLFGVYQNSYYNPAAYIAKQWTPDGWRLGQAQFGFFVGAATGYRQVSGDEVVPIGGLLMRYQLTEQYAVNVLGTPPIGRMDGVLHLAISRHFQ